MDLKVGTLIRLLNEDYEVLGIVVSRFDQYHNFIFSDGICEDFQYEDMNYEYISDATPMTKLLVTTYCRSNSEE